MSEKSMKKVPWEVKRRIFLSFFISILIKVTNITFNEYEPHALFLLFSYIGYLSDSYVKVNLILSLSSSILLVRECLAVPELDTHKGILEDSGLQVLLRIRTFC